MIGSISEAFYGIPQVIRERGFVYLPKEFKVVVSEFESRFSKK